METKSSEESSSSNQLHLLSDDELMKLTRSNTRKNVGGYKRRLASQLERICRRFDNIATDVKLTERVILEALPVVDPTGEEHEDKNKLESICNRSNTTSSFHTEEKQVERQENVDATERRKEEKKDDDKIKREADEKKENNENISAKDDSIEYTNLFSDDSFEIEPATQDSFYSHSSISLASTGRSNRSVRISSAVTILDYKNNKRNSAPSSVSMQKRMNHPTRSGKNFRIKRALAQGNGLSLQRINSDSSKHRKDLHLKYGGDESGSLSISSNSSSGVRRTITTDISNISAIGSPTSPYGNRVKNWKRGECSLRETSNVENKNED